MKISDEYYEAFKAGKISLILDVGRRKGELKRSGIRKWSDHGLTVVIDDKNFTMVATYNKKLVAASLRDRCIFEDGQWFNIITWNQMEIEEAERGDAVNKLMKKDEN